MSRDERESIWIVLAAYNEQQVVGEVVAGVRERYPNAIVVDDGSTDATFDRAREAGAVVLRHPVNRGQGAALQTGMTWALDRGATVVVTFDSDGQHRVSDIETLIAPIREGRAEAVLGSRFLGAAEGITGSRLVVLKLAVLLTRVMSGMPVTDAHNGLRAFSRRAASGIHITLDRMAHASEILDQVGASGLAYLEVPVRVRYTDYSRSKGQPLSAAFRILLSYLARRLFR